jgi:hypothetical protein
MLVFDMLLSSHLCFVDVKQIQKVGPDFQFVTLAFLVVLVASDPPIPLLTLKPGKTQMGRQNWRQVTS